MEGLQHIRPRKMHGDLGQIQSRIVDVMPSCKLLGANHHGIPGGVLIWRPYQGLTGGYLRRPDVPHHSQDGVGRSDPTLGGGGGGKRGRSKGFWYISLDYFCALICG